MRMSLLLFFFLTNSLLVENDSGKNIVRDSILADDFDIWLFSVTTCYLHAVKESLKKEMEN